MSRRRTYTIAGAAITSAFLVQVAGGCSSVHDIASSIGSGAGVAGTGGSGNTVSGAPQAGNPSGSGTSGTATQSPAGSGGARQTTVGGGGAGSGGGPSTGNSGGPAGSAAGDGSSGRLQETSGRGGRSGSGGSVAPTSASGAGGSSGKAGGSTGKGGGGASTTPTNGAGGAGAGKGGAAAGAGGTPDSTGDVIARFQNGVFWNDTTGKRIEAHGGGFIQVDGTWYWVGEDKSANSGGFKAVNCYSSKDLQNWKFERAIITPSTNSKLAAAGRIVERPKVIYNDTTKKYVMWLHWEGNNYADAEAGVFSSDTVCGSYKYESNFRPNNNMSRDCTLFKDDDGKAYFLSAANENADMMMYELSADYLTMARQVAKLWAGAKREAPAVFKQAGRYYFITSACTGWDPNQAQYSTATSMEGPWSALKNLANGTTYDTQSTYVIPVVGSKATTFIYAGDRWQDPDLASSKYIWLPLKVNGTALTLDNYTKWQLNVTTGEWSTGNLDDGYVPQSGWKLLRADSEETEKENGQATNAFDNSDTTIWHTQYTPSTVKLPHELQIDLGASYAIQGVRLLPRQDKDANGIIARYEFYASEDSSNWGTAVASGTLDSTRNEHLASFPKMNARYVRLVALSEINGKDYTSLAELDLVPAK